MSDCHSLFKNPPLASFSEQKPKSLQCPTPYDWPIYTSVTSFSFFLFSWLHFLLLISLLTGSSYPGLSAISWTYQDSCLITVSLASTWNVLLLQIARWSLSHLLQILLKWLLSEALLVHHIYLLSPRLICFIFLHEIYHLLIHYKIYLFCFCFPPLE